MVPRQILLAILVCAAVAVPGLARAHGSHDERLASIERRIASDPAQAESYLQRSVLYREHGDFNEALSDLGRAEQLAPGDARTLLLRGRLFLAWGRPADALPPLEQLVAREPRQPEAQLALARALAREGRPLEAARHYDRAIEHAPVLTPTHYLERAQALAAAGQEHLDAAVAGLDAGVEQLGPAAALTSYAIELELRRGRADAALARLDRTAPHLRGAIWWARRGEILERAGRSEEARTDYVEALLEIEALPPHKRETPAWVRQETRTREALARVEGR